MNKHPDLIDELMGMSCFSSLGKEKVSLLSERARRRSVARGDILFEETEPVRSLFVLKSGAVKLYKTSLEGRELIFRIVRPGEYFCCEPMFTDGICSLSAVAVEESVMIVIEADGLKELLYGEIGELGLHIIEDLSRKIKYLYDFIEDLTFRDVEERLMRTLLRLADERTTDDIVTLSLTHRDIASMAGTVREVVSRRLSGLKKKGVIVDSTVKGFTIDKKMLLSLTGSELAGLYSLKGQ